MWILSVMNIEMRMRVFYLDLSSLVCAEFGVSDVQVLSRNIQAVGIDRSAKLAANPRQPAKTTPFISRLHHPHFAVSIDPPEVQRFYLFFIHLFSLLILLSLLPFNTRLTASCSFFSLTPSPKPIPLLLFSSFKSFYFCL